MTTNGFTAKPLPGIYGENLGIGNDAGANRAPLFMPLAVILKTGV
ncbi:MAG: hypothetical protein U0894_13845 [Pirellulales bacterium]